MKIELSVLSVYSVLSVSFYLNPCYTGMEIEHISTMESIRTLCLNPCYTGMEIEPTPTELEPAYLDVLILVILEWR